MSEFVSTLQHVSLRGSSYLIVLANESDYSTSLQRHLENAIAMFGENVGIKARIVRSYKNKTASVKIFRELAHKAWPSDIKARIEKKNPFLILIRKDFSEFDPQKHDWIIVWLSSLGSSEKMIPNFFDRLDKQLERDQDLLAFLRSKLDGNDHAFPKGSLSARGYVDSELPVKKPGRKGMLRDVSLTEIRRIVEMYQVNLSTRGGKMELSRHLSETITDRIGNHFQPKSICDALTREKYFEKLSKPTTR